MGSLISAGAGTQDSRKPLNPGSNYGAGGQSCTGRPIPSTWLGTIVEKTVHVFSQTPPPSSSPHAEGPAL